MARAKLCGSHYTQALLALTICFWINGSASAKIIDDFAIWVLANVPKFEEGAFREMGLHEPVLELFRSPSKNARKYAADYARAAEWYERAVSIGTDHVDEAMIALTLSNIGGVLGTIGDYPREVFAADFDSDGFNFDGVSYLSFVGRNPYLT